MNVIVEGGAVPALVKHLQAPPALSEGNRSRFLHKVVYKNKNRRERNIIIKKSKNYYFNKNIEKIERLLEDVFNVNAFALHMWRMFYIYCWRCYKKRV